MKSLHILGMGSAGQSILACIDQFFPTVETVYCYDDDPKKIGSTAHGTVVQGPIETALNRYTFKTIDTVLIAMPSVSKSRIAQLYRFLRKKYCDSIQIIPGSTPIIEGEVYLHNIRPIKPEDVIGRSYQSLQLHSHKQEAETKHILIAGAGGSLGQELALQCLWLSFSTIYLMGHGETSIIRIYRKLKQLQKDGLSPHTNIIPVILDLQDKAALKQTIAALQIDFVINTIAHKHVLLMEDHAYAAFANNVVGLINLYDVLQEYPVGRILQVSTDKAVNPHSTYGLTKMIGEALSLHGSLPATVVRFGNILSSRGSIAEVIKNHALTQPLQLTDPDSERYYMSVSEAASLILRLLFDGKDHAIYGFDMGAPMKLKDMVDALLQFYFPHVHDAIQLNYTGLADSEKISEELIASNEQIRKTNIPQVFSIHTQSSVSTPNKTYYQTLRRTMLDLLDPSISHAKIRKQFFELQETYLHETKTHASSVSTSNARTSITNE